jgi:hypothetical protein
LSYEAADHPAGADDLYTCVALTFPKRAATSAGRPKAEHSVGIAGAWLDIDAPDLHLARSVAYAVAEPTLLVDSGHGLHAWWLFDKPWQFQSTQDRADAATLAWQWQQHHRNLTGVKLDATHDLARLMRLPTTINTKGGGRAPVELIAATHHRYTIDDIRATAAAAGPAPHAGTSPAGAGGSTTTINTTDTLPAETLDALLDDPDFHAAWTHTGHLLWTISEWDMSIASQLHHAGVTDDQQIANILCAHRRHWNPADPKATRPDYLARTITKARAEHISPADRLRNMAKERRAA